MKNIDIIRIIYYSRGVYNRDILFPQLIIFILLKMSSSTQNNFAPEGGGGAGAKQS